MSKIPLKTRKSIKAALESINVTIAKASASFGKELTFIDNSSDLFDKLQAAEKSQDWLFDLGNYIKVYPEQLQAVLQVFCNNEENKEQLQAELTTGKIGIRIVENDKEDVYFRIEEGTLWMETKASWFGNYLGNYSAELLETKLGATDSLPLNTRKNLKGVQGAIEKNITDASTAFGKELQWVDNYQELYDRLKKSGKNEDWLWKLGDHILNYPKKLHAVFTVFCKDPDNKEALEEALTTGKVGVRIVDNDKNDQYWALEDGSLWMETKENWFGYYLDNYSADLLEKKL